MVGAQWACTAPEARMLERDQIYIPETATPGAVPRRGPGGGRVTYIAAALAGVVLAVAVSGGRLELAPSSSPTTPVARTHSAISQVAQSLDTGPALTLKRCTPRRAPAQHPPRSSSVACGHEPGA